MARALRLGLLLVACGPTPPETSAAGSSGDPTTDATLSAGTSMTGREPTGSTTPDPTTGTTADSTTADSTTADSTAADSTSTTTGVEVCVDRDPDEVSALWSFLDENTEPPLSFSADCTVASIEELSPASAYIRFACALDGEPLLTLSYIREPARPPPLNVGEEVHVDYRQEEQLWLQQWFSVRAAGDGATKYAGIAAATLAPPDATTEEFYAATLVPLSGICPALPVPCGTDERLAVAVGLGDASHTLFDGQFRQLVHPSGDYSVWLGQAVRAKNVHCDPYPVEWFQVMMVLDSGP